VPLPVFSYFLKLASQLYGDVPVGKGEDDGAVFGEFLKESRFPIAMKSIAWEEIRDIMEKYKVCGKLLTAYMHVLMGFAKVHTILTQGLISPPNSPTHLSDTLPPGSNHGHVPVGIGH
jgi:hypothetical protein